MGIPKLLEVGCRREAELLCRGCAYEVRSVTMNTQFDELKVGDRVEVERLVTEGQTGRTAKTCGTVVRVERSRHGLSCRGYTDGEFTEDTLLLELPDGELASIPVDEFTTIRRM